MTPPLIWDDWTLPEPTPTRYDEATTTDLYGPPDPPLTHRGPFIRRFLPTVPSDGHAADERCPGCPCGRGAA